LRQALQRWPGDLRLQVFLADACCTLGEMAEAETLVASLLERERATSGAWLVLARVRLAQGKLSEADAALAEAAGLNPTAPTEARTLGDLLKRRGRLFEALHWHHRAVGGDGNVSLPATNQRRRVVFVVQHGPAWPSTASVWQAFAADSQWETTVVALPYRHPYYPRAEDQNAIFGFLHDAGVPYVSWDQFPMVAGCADLIFLQNPYDVTRPPGWRTTELMRLVPRIAYIPYALEIGGGQEYASMQANLATQQLAWAVFARSNRHRIAFEKDCVTGAAHVHVTGHPKMDALSQLPTLHDAEIERFVADRKMVFWNPQFDVRPDGSVFGKGFSTFLRWQQYLPDEFARRRGLALVIRPHPLFFATLEQRKILTPEQTREFLARCSAAGALIDQRPSYLPVFAASTAMISDASSFLFEYAGTGRPLLYLRNPAGPGLNSDGEFVTKYCYTAQTEEEIRQFLDLVEAGQDPSAATRRAAYKELMYVPPEGAGRTIKRAIESRLAAEMASELQPAYREGHATELWTVNKNS
jgi:tetratricopeptide (TPR) repeat protein